MGIIDLLSTIYKAQPKNGKVILIAVDGHGGSGKSTFAQILSQRLNAQIVHIDDFSGWDNPSDWYLDVIQMALKPIANGAQTLSYQPASWWENHSPEPVVNQPVTDIMILEGVSSSRKEFRDYISLSIFVDTPREICLQRGVERDVSTGQTEQEVIELWKKWFKEEDEYMMRDNPKEYADIIIDGTKPFEEQI